MSRSRLTRTLVALALMGAATLTTTAVAADHANARGEYLQKLVAELDLTTEQNAALTELKADVKDLKKEWQSGRLDVFQEVIDKLDAESIDRKGLHALADKRMDALSDAVHDGIDGLLDFVGSLDAKQKDTLVTGLQAGHDKLEARQGEK